MKSLRPAVMFTKFFDCVHNSYFMLKKLAVVFIAMSLETTNHNDAERHLHVSHAHDEMNPDSRSYRDEIMKVCTTANVASKTFFSRRSQDLQRDIVHSRRRICFHFHAPVRHAYRTERHRVLLDGPTLATG